MRSDSFCRRSNSFFISEMTLLYKQSDFFIGGVTLLRAAAKNHERVTVLCDPTDYQG